MVLYFIPFVSNYESTVDHDEFQVAEKIKRRRKHSFIILPKLLYYIKCKFDFESKSVYFIS